MDDKPLLCGRGPDGDDDGGTFNANARKMWPRVPDAGDTGWPLYPPPDSSP